MAYADIHNGDSVAYPTGQTIDYNLSVSDAMYITMGNGTSGHV